MLIEARVKFSALLLFLLSSIIPINAQAQTISPVSSTTGITLIFGNYIQSNDGRFKLTLQADGNMVLTQGSAPLWSSNTQAVKYTHWDGYPLTAPQVRQACRAAFQTDGNFVVYGIWLSPAASIGPIYDTSACATAPESAFFVMWRSNTHGNPGSKLYVQDDGNVVIYNSANRALWSTKTCCR